MTITADRQVEFNGLRLDGAYEIQSIEGLADSAEVRPSDRLLVARNGYVPGYDYLGGRTITITVDVTSFSSATFHTAVADLRSAFAAAPGSTEHALTFQLPGVADGVTAKVNARARRISLPLEQTYWADVATATIELFATDPLIYEATDTVTSLALATASGGMTFPITFNLTFGTTGISGISTVTNAGSAPSAPSFRIYGPITTPTLRSETLDRAITVNLAVASGDYLDIDVKNRSVLLNGTTSRYSSLSSAQWWELQPGANQVRFTAASGSGTTDMTWRSAWY